ncbi:MAG: high frequency lysogenization protein HflD [Salinisphaera sp.]|nr:high frequency lysogenization protein HflD [Salinisphaera sp.]
MAELFNDRSPGMRWRDVMESPNSERVLALAGMVQALAQVRQIAMHGRCDRHRTEPCIRALLGIYEGDMAALYGGRDLLIPGLHLLADHLTHPSEVQLTRYLVSVLHLERKLTSNRARLREVIEGVRRAAEQATYFSALHDNVIRNLGAIYTEKVSSIRPPVIISGERAYLDDPRNAALIRALLLSAIRAASLWRQAGGNRLRLIFFRNRLIAEAHRQQATS